MKKQKITSAPPKRYRVIQEIIKNIENGTLKNGERLATVRKLSEHFNVSVSVVQNAMKELMDEGFVECRGVNGFYVCAGDPEVEIPENKIQKDTEEKIFLSAVHHSDLVWRYPYNEYNRIRAEQLLHLIDLAERYPQFHFGVEQAEIMRVFAEEYPKKFQTLKKLYQEGRFEFFGGLCIPDLNLISGESIVRNMVLGRNIYKELFGKASEICCMNDAFGMCAQLPQILAKSGFKYLLPGRRPNIPQDLAQAERPFYWCGMDESKVLLAHGLVDVTHLGYTCNVPVIHDFESQLTYNVAALKQKKGDLLVHYMTEEGNVMEELFWIMEAVNRNPGRRVEFGRNLDFFRKVEQNELQEYRGEFNPTFSGCYSTRITVKQRNRKAENLLTAAEMLDVFAGTRQDWTPYWHELIKVQFHDGICGCHHDLANLDITKKLEYVLSGAGKRFRSKTGKKFSIAAFGTGTGSQLVRLGRAPEGVAAQKDGDQYYCVLELPNCGIKTFTAANHAEAKTRKASKTFRTDFYDVDFSSPFPVIRNRNGENVFSDDHFGEIVYRVDYGTMWAEKFLGGRYGHAQQKETVISREEGPVFFKVVTEGEILERKPSYGNLGNQWPGFVSLKFRKEYIFPKHHDTFRLKVKLDWQGNNTMIGIRFPVDLQTKNMTETYEVPFGSLVRKPYFEVREEFESTLKSLAKQNDYVTAKGNWPALNWVNYSDLKKGLTVANTGTPGHQLVNNEIFVTLLRSGTDIRDGNMVPQQGSFDNGIREYEFAFCAHKPAEMEKAALLGRQLNAPPAICNVPTEGEFLVWDKENIMLSALYHHDDGILVRLYETLGRQTTASIKGKLLTGRELYEADMEGNIQKDTKSEIEFRPFEIKTFILK